MFFCSGTILFADEINNKYYVTNGNYYSDSNYWWNAGAAMHTRSGFKYGETPQGGDYNCVRNTKYYSSDKVISRVKDPKGNVKSSTASSNAYVKIGALKGTDYHKFVD